jgi:hypothetical protein
LEPTKLLEDGAVHTFSLEFVSPMWAGSGERVVAVTGEGPSREFPRMSRYMNKNEGESQGNACGDEGRLCSRDPLTLPERSCGKIRVFTRAEMGAPSSDGALFAAAGCIFCSAFGFQ